MKRSDTSTPPQTNRRALIAHHDAVLLADPEVVAFLDGTWPDGRDSENLQCKFVAANEPALLVELVRATQCTFISLSVTSLVDGRPHTLPTGVLDHVLQHLGNLPSVEELDIDGADLTTPTCVLLQTALLAPGCNVVELTLTNCCFATAQVVFPNQAPKVEKFKWYQHDPAIPVNNALTQLLPSLAGWASLAMLNLYGGNVPLNFGVLAQLLQIRPSLKSLSVASYAVPLAGGHPATDPQLDPALLFNAIKRNQTAVNDLSLNLVCLALLNFDDHVLQLLADCLSVNTTLESVSMPGIMLCSDGARRQFVQDLWHNSTLIGLDPVGPFGLISPAPLRRNQTWYYKFSPEFVMGAAEGFMMAWGAPPELGSHLGSAMVSESADRVNGGRFMAMVCRASHANAVRLRSVCLRDALITHLAADTKAACERAFAVMAKNKVELLPADKAALVARAIALGRTNYLPPGYAG